MKNEKQNEIKKSWYEEFATKTYKNIKYNIYKTTPKEAENKIISFLDKIDYDIKNYTIDILTEGSKAVIIDLWVFEKYITERNIYSNTFLITRQKYKGNKYGYRIRHIL